MTLRGATVALPGLMTALIIDLLSIGYFIIEGSHWQIEVALELLAAGLIAGIFIFIYHNLLAPLEMVSEAITKLAAGNLTARADIGNQRYDEIGALAQNLNRLADFIQQEAEHCRNFIMTIPDPVIEMDSKGFITYLNTAACSATGYTPSDLTNSPFTGILQPGTEYLLADALEGLVRDKGAQMLELTLLTKDGRPSVFEFTCSLVLKEWNTVAIRCIGRDMQERGKLIEELKAARAQAKEAAEKLKRATRDIEELALLAVRRESRMQEIRERFLKLKQRHNLSESVV